MSREFKVGDRVRCVRPFADLKRCVGLTGTVICTGSDGFGVQFDEFIDGHNCSGKGKHGYCRFGDESEVISLENKTMSKITEKFALALLPEPKKSFRKAGITNGDNLLTEDGMKIFLSWLLTQNEDKFKTEVVDNLLEDKKDDE